MIKSHLKRVFPKVIILCYIKNGEESMTESEFGGIIVNEFYITKFKNLDYNSSKLSKITEAQKNDIAMNFFLYFIHEVSSHNKYAISEDGKNSPQKIFNKNKKIMTLRHKNDNDPNDNNNEYILTSDNNKGDSGHFLELGYGKYKNELIIDILRKMENKGKLINYPELFTDDGKKLNEYVSLRKQLEENKINFDFNTELTIYQEIEQMKKELDNIKIKNNKIENLINDNIDEINQDKSFSKRKRNRDKKDIEGDNGNIKNQMKKYEPNYLRSINIMEKKDKKEDEILNIEEEPLEKDDFFDREKRLKIARRRVVEKFKFNLGPNLKTLLKEKIKEVDLNDPYYSDLALLLSDCYLKF